MYDEGMPHTATAAVKVGSTSHLPGGYFFTPHRQDFTVAYAYGRDGRGRYLGAFPTDEAAAAAITAKAGR